MIEDENTDRDTIYSMPLEAENWMMKIIAFQFFWFFTQKNY
jgi:hypothetical protein